MLALTPNQRLTEQLPGVVFEVILDEAGDEVVAVVVTRLHTDINRLPGGIACRLEVIGQ